MPNCNNTLEQSDVVIETVPQQLNTQENTYFILTIAFVLGLAFALLYDNHAEHKNHITMPKQLTNMMTQLSNGFVEVAMLQEAHMLPKSPSLEMLRDLNLSPFSDHPWQALSNCWLLSYQDAFIKVSNEEGKWLLFWRLSENQHIHTDPIDCHNEDHWQPVKLEN